MAMYTKLPSRAKSKPTPFVANIPEPKLNLMLDLIKLSPIGPQTYETQDESRNWGINPTWLSEAKDRWISGYDWRASEKRINGFPNYTIEITDDDGTKYTVHFIALFSDNEDAIPISFFHGWPGSFLEFLDMLDIIKKKYTADKLPYHIVVPSLIGFAFSSGPPTTKDCSCVDLARICRKLMHELGFGSRYVAQGGDIGQFVTRQAAQLDPACKAFHVNELVINTPPKNRDDLPVTELEAKHMPRGKEMLDHGLAYAQTHGTRGATIGLMLCASPLAMLAWIGEKFLDWSDETPPLDRILESVSLYWLTDTYPRCVYTYRDDFSDNKDEIEAQSIKRGDDFDKKPMGLSWFPYDLDPVPVSWSESVGNLVWYRRHTSGGHFAAMEKPAELFADVEEFLKVVWK